jgi:hypothetical protein
VDVSPKLNANKAKNKEFFLNDLTIEYSIAITKNQITGSLEKPITDVTLTKELTCTIIAILMNPLFKPIVLNAIINNNIPNKKNKQLIS